MVPRSGWSWARAVAAAKGLLPYAFEKDDACEKYSGENFFAVVTGGRSLRFTASRAYGFDPTIGEDAAPGAAAAAAALAQLEEAVRGSWRALERGGGGGVFDDVGGAEAWKGLAAPLKREMRRSAGFRV